MKLSRLRLEQFQQFRTSLEVNDLGEGINLFAGPNESGKSTLVRAIRAAFFERHRSTSLGELQPWGESSAAPEVTLAFTWQGQEWQLDKRFLRRQRCELVAAGEHLNGDEAEERLAELLGYQFPGRGASKAEHWGIPGLLWVEQGAGQEVRDSVGHAGEHLQSALVGSLGEALGEMTSSSGDALIQQVERERGRLLTATGRPTGDLREAQQACETLEDELAQQEEAVRRYQASVDRLGELEREQQEIDAARPWEAQREKARAAEQQLRAVEKLQQQQAQEQRDLEGCQRQQRLYRQQLQDFETQAEQLVTRQQDNQKARSRLEACQVGEEPVRRHLTDATAAYEQAAARLQAARERDHRQTRQAEHDRLAEQVATLDETLGRARSLRDALQRLAADYQAQAVDGKALGELQRLEAELGRLAIQQHALATRLGFSLEAGQRLELDGQTLSGEGETLLLEQAELRIPGVGRLTIQPGGTDVTDLLRRQQRREAERDALLQRLGVADLTTAEAQARRARELEQQIQEARARLEGLAPEGVDALESQHRLAVKGYEQLAAELAGLPAAEQQAELPSMAQAQTELDSAGEALKAAEQAEVAYRQQLSLAKQALATAGAEWQRLHDELNAPDRQRRQQEARDALTDLKAEEQRLATSLQALKRQIDAANPELLAQDVERFSRAADAMQRHAREREAEITQLRIRLETLGANGLEEQRDETRQRKESQQRRREQLQRRAAALDLLLTLLKEQRQEVTLRLQAPLQKHLNRYLKLLFPGAELTVDEELKPETLIRTDASPEERGDLEALSFGAREQMGLISRLAYADLLQEAGRPTLIILDDALVHCDQARREQMKRILFDAAQRHQILMFTCHPENWQDLGVVPRDMRTLKEAS
ncbi:AAA family ATPase [Halomonas ventosae]|uniref:DNA repair exonuclease SbcCD ATPase subunit n=1 Tax=Halomonas ventosae TaxID=229007 RepID=A0A4R6GT65_9GAMM|nr:AAA family ATPase [Halomonas ventosae]TDN97834.1 DNA repair exonuclease SbcCD ATPase subunit [Halomonas ventosae]